MLNRMANEQGAAVSGKVWVPYVNGEWVSDEGDVMRSVNPFGGAETARVRVATREDADAAVAAASAAFDAWSGLALGERTAILKRFADEIDSRAEQFAQVITAEVGTPIKLSRRVQVGLPQTTLRTTLRLASEFDWQETVGNSLVVSEPIGVVAAITPWNYPLHQGMCKIAPALATGCTVVLKPASLTPVHALLLAEAADAAGLPAGVFNVLPGGGGTIGERLATHPDVDMVTFTGSTEVGRRIGALAAETVKRVGLELGGKSACVILDDADLEGAVKSAVRNGLLNSGQTCSAWTRIIVAREQLHDAAEIAGATAAKMVIGDPLDEGTQLGPLISAQHKATVVAHIARARQEGLAELEIGADAAAFEGTNFVAPHVFTNVTSRHGLAQEEVFGPVLAIMPADDDDDAVRIANDSIYGLAGGVFSADPDRALSVAKRMRTGQVDINGGRFNPEAPFGGYRQSGNGRELGKHGLAEFLEIKAIQR